MGSECVSTYCQVLKGTGSQWVVSVCQQSLAGNISKTYIYIYRATVELSEAAQLCVFILGMQYLYLGILKYVLGMGVN